MSAQRAVMLSVLEDHLDSAAARLRSWERSLASDRYTIEEVAAGLEARSLASLKGLASGGPRTVEQLLLPALESDDTYRSFAAAIALLEGGGGCSEVLRRLEAPDASPLLGWALGLTANPEVDVALCDVVANGHDAARIAAALEILAFRGADLGPIIVSLLPAADPGLRAAALRAARGSISSGLSVRFFADRALSAPETGVRDAAIDLGITSRSRLAWVAAQQAVDSGEPGSEVPLLVLASSGESSDVLRLVKLVGNERHRSAALFALGFTGSAVALDVCLAAMEDLRVAGVAGEAFSAITGLRIDGQYRRATERRSSQRPISFEEDDLDASLVPTPESELPLPAPTVIKQWWSSNRSRFQAEVRYIGGVPLDAALLCRAFCTAPTRRRGALGLALRIRTRGEWRVETRQWARVQLANQSAEAKAVVMLPFGQFLEA